MGKKGRVEFLFVSSPVSPSSGCFLAEVARHLATCPPKVPDPGPPGVAVSFVVQGHRNTPVPCLSDVSCTRCFRLHLLERGSLRGSGWGLRCFRSPQPRASAHPAPMRQRCGRERSRQGPGFPLLLMPFVEGESLRDRLDREGRLTIDEAPASHRLLARRRRGRFGPGLPVFAERCYAAAADVGVRAQFRCLLL
jgi:hypothetical protein